jgi:hypothetical protein
MNFYSKKTVKLMLIHRRRLKTVDILSKPNRERESDSDEDEISNKKIANLPYELKIADENDIDEDGLVYPMSIRYDRKADTKKKIIKYSFLALLFVLFILLIIFSTPPFRTFSIRLEYFADRITKKTVSLNGISEISIHTKD